MLRNFSLNWCALLHQITRWNLPYDMPNESARKLSPLKGVIKTATTDNGKEFAAHKEIAEALRIDVFFAHPYHPWERGANESMTDSSGNTSPRNHHSKTSTTKISYWFRINQTTDREKGWNFWLRLNIFCVTLHRQLKILIKKLHLLLEFSMFCPAWYENTIKFA